MIEQSNKVIPLLREEPSQDDNLAEIHADLLALVQKYESGEHMNSKSIPELIAHIGLVMEMRDRLTRAVLDEIKSSLGLRKIKTDCLPAVVSRMGQEKESLHAKQAKMKQNLELAIATAGKNPIISRKRALKILREIQF